MDGLEAVGDPGLRSALAFVRGAEHAVTADELAEHGGIHRNVARARLERLAGAGLRAPARLPGRARRRHDRDADVPAAPARRSAPGGRSYRRGHVDGARGPPRVVRGRGLPRSDRAMPHPGPDPIPEVTMHSYRYLVVG